MRSVEKSDDFLELREAAPGPVVGGIFFLLFGLLPILDPSVLPDDEIQIALMWIISPGLICLGLASVWSTVVVRITLDREANRVVVAHRRLLWSKDYETALDNIAGIAIESKNDGEGATFRTKFRLHNGNSIYWSPNRKKYKDKIGPVEAWLNHAK